VEQDVPVPAGDKAAAPAAAPADADSKTKDIPK
jgi:hypothetical protein